MNNFTDEQRVEIAEQEYKNFKEGEPITINSGETIKKQTNKAMYTRQLKKI